MRILSIDDSRTIRRSVRNMTEVLENVDFLEAENGKKALEVLESVDGKIDLILLDWEMPEMDGHEFLKIIKADSRYSSIPVIMLTAVSQKDKVINAIRSGAKQYITKPFSGEELLTKIIQAVGVDSFDEL